MQVTCSTDSEHAQVLTPLEEGSTKSSEGVFN